MTPNPGYSGTPLSQKLGLKDGHRFAWTGMLVCLLPSAILMTSMTTSPAASADGAAEHAGCWELRDTQKEIGRRGEDPFYHRQVTYCFDEHEPGQIVIRAFEFSGYRDEHGKWVNGSGDGWDFGVGYEVEGGQLQMRSGRRLTLCNIALSADVLALSDCEGPDAFEEDVSFDRRAPAP